MTMPIPEAQSSPTEEPAPRLPRWVSLCWPQSWRESYGDEIADTWAETGARRSDLRALALQGLRQRVTRPVAAASLDTTHARPGHDVAIVGHPRYLFRLVTMIVVGMLITVVQLIMTFAFESAETSTGVSRSAMTHEDFRLAVSMTFLTGLPLVVASFGIKRMDYPDSRDLGVGLLLGAALFVLLLISVPVLLGP